MYNSLFRHFYQAADIHMYIQTYMSCTSLHVPELKTGKRSKINYRESLSLPGHSRGFAEKQLPVVVWPSSWPLTPPGEADEQAPTSRGTRFKN